ncbi:hypothetical protein FSP39_003989 [Pinctada imbricata]|uniref:Uncharacterized protein n=1 Tax=Pinctada imbricata TaxID=66713 RepID=A0AA89BPS2_PINIB|nr:hypothetical protein FSP39_003989 [Pinctada imbricata]
MTMDCLVQQPIWTGGYHHGGLASLHHHYFSPYYFPRKRSAYPCSYFAGAYGLPSRLDDDVAFPTDIKLERADDCIPDDDKDFKICVVCGERASGYYFGALVCLPCKSFYIRCTKDGEPNFTCQCNGNCDIAKQGRIRCQYCRYQRCLMAGMCRKEKPETVQPQDGQVLCKVCGDIANGIHFGVNTCEGCKKFFRRGLVENQSYLCKSEKKCGINPRNRNNCRYCRYQKCIGVGMSREAIKMGRPKKAETSDLAASSNITEPLSFEDSSSSPISPSRQDKTPSPQGHSLSPSSTPPRATGSPLFDLSKVKTEPIITDLDQNIPEEQNQSSMVSIHSDGQMYTPTPITSYATSSVGNWTSATSSMPMVSQPQMSCAQTNWHQHISHSVAQQQMITSTPTSSNVTMTTSKTGVNDSTMMYEDDMDEILDYLSQDSHAPQLAQNNQNSQCIMGNTSVPSFPVPTQKQFDQQIRDFRDHHSPVHNDHFNQLTIDTAASPMSRDCAAMYSQVSPHGHQYPSSPSHTQYNSNSPTGAQSQMYAPHSPSQDNMYGTRQTLHKSMYNQTSPQQDAQYGSSPVMQNNMYGPSSPSAQSGPYSPQPSHFTPSSNQVYPHSQYQPPSESCQYNAGSPASNYSAGSPASHYSAGSPASHYNAGSPVSHCSMSPPYQPAQSHTQQPNNVHHGPYMDVKASMRINQQFLNCDNMGYVIAENEEPRMDGLTKHDVDSTVVENCLKKNVGFAQYRCQTNYSPGSSPRSVHSGSDDSQDGYQEGSRMNRKRKAVNESCSFGGRENAYSQCLYNQGGQNDFICERYSMMDTQAYWSRPLSYSGPMVPQDEAFTVIKHLMNGYNKIKDVCDESKSSRNSLDVHWPKMGSESNHWSHIQRRSIRNTLCCTEFFKSIPGYEKINTDDMFYLALFNGFQACYMLNAVDLFDEANECFRYFWNFTVSPNNPMYFFKLHLVQNGQKVNKLNMSPVEKAMMVAITLFAADFRNLKDPEAIEDMRQRLINILMAHLAAQGVDPVKRVQELFSVVPGLRHMTMWHKQLMKMMKANIELQEVQQVFDDLVLNMDRFEPQCAPSTCANSSSLPPF